MIPVDQIIGGPDHADRGWQMLMEALSGGRAVSLPAGAVTGAKHTARVAGATAWYASSSVCPSAASRESKSPWPGSPVPPT